MENPKCGNCGNYMTQINSTEWYCLGCDNYYDPTMPLPEIAYAISADPDCYYCGGTGMHPDGFHDCPECMKQEGCA